MHRLERNTFHDIECIKPEPKKKKTNKNKTNKIKRKRVGLDFYLLDVLWNVKDSGKTKSREEGSVPFILLYHRRFDVSCFFHFQNSE